MNQEPAEYGMKVTTDLSQRSAQFDVTRYCSDEMRHVACVIVIRNAYEYYICENLKP
jgi:hypothetical protein